MLNISSLSFPKKAKICGGKRAHRHIYIYIHIEKNKRKKKTKNKRPHPTLIIFVFGMFVSFGCFYSSFLEVFSHFYLEKDHLWPTYCFLACCCWCNSSYFLFFFFFFFFFFFSSSSPSCFCFLFWLVLLLLLVLRFIIILLFWLICLLLVHLFVLFLHLNHRHHHHYNFILHCLFFFFLLFFLFFLIFSFFFLFGTSFFENQRSVRYLESIEAIGAFKAWSLTDLLVADVANITSTNQDRTAKECIKKRCFVFFVGSSAAFSGNTPHLTHKWCFFKAWHLTRTDVLSPSRVAGILYASPLLYTPPHP